MEHITRCPACEIAFHVTDDQLQLAAGKVRCGACLSIFDARSHIESHLEEKEPDHDDEPLIHDGMNPEALAEDESHPSSETEPESTSEPETSPEPEPLEPLPLPPKPPVPALEHTPPSDEEPVIALGCDNDGSVIELGCDSSSSSDLDAAEEECPFTTPTRKRKRRPLTAAACVLALLTLPVQYVYFHFEELASDPQHHRWLTSACKVIGCQVPPLTDLGNITSTKLIVVSHPEQPQALLIEAVLENRASFAQPFPALLLKFDDLNGGTVAKRRFQPPEYLLGELSGETEFPPRRPVRIRLELDDPGPDATNYQLLVTE